jgi:hypothetical protein
MGYPIVVIKGIVKIQKRGVKSRGPKKGASVLRGLTGTKIVFSCIFKGIGH